MEMTTDSSNSASGFAQVIDAETLARARRGDTQAHTVLYQRFGRASFNLALRVLGNRAAAEDVVQDVFLKLLGAIRSYRGEAPIGAWLKRMTVNAAIDQLRAQRHLEPEDPERLFEHVAIAGTLPDDAHDAMALLQRLPARARLILVLHELEGYTHKELAVLFGQSESYSKSILSRALVRLQEWLQPVPQESDIVELRTCANRH
ncbi:MAG: RNA polymerase sigma factor [Tahibacter sp.]